MIRVEVLFVSGDPIGGDLLLRRRQIQIVGNFSSGVRDSIPGDSSFADRLRPILKNN